VFGAGKGGFSGWGQSKARMDRRSGLSGWRIHDLRRTSVTGMAEIGIQPHVIEAVVNHVSGHKGGVAGIYNRAGYAAEKRDALQRWADHVEEIIAGRGAKVCSFPNGQMNEA
jgi:integrase